MPHDSDLFFREFNYRRRQSIVKINESNGFEHVKLAMFHFSSFSSPINHILILLFDLFYNLIFLLGEILDFFSKELYMI